MWDFISIDVKTKDCVYRCTHCGARLFVSGDDYLNRHKKCKQCGNRNVQGFWSSVLSSALNDDASDDDWAMFFTSGKGKDD